MHDNLIIDRLFPWMKNVSFNQNLLIYEVPIKSEL